MRFCTACGSTLPVGSRFCGSCGLSVEPATTASVATESPPAATTAFAGSHQRVTLTLAPVGLEGLILIPFGLVLLLVAIVLAFTVIGLFISIPLGKTAIEIMKGSAGRTTMSCPYCGRAIVVYNEAENVTCPKCGNLTVIDWVTRSGLHLGEAIEAERAATRQAFGRIERGLDRIIVVVVTYLATTFVAWNALRYWPLQFMFGKEIFAVVTGWLAFKIVGAKNRQSIGWRIRAAASLAVAVLAVIQVVNGRFFYVAEELPLLAGVFFGSAFILRLSRYSPSH